MSRISRFTILILIAVITSPTLADIKPASIFSDNMVLQREKPIIIWGSAAPNEKITATLGEQSAQTSANTQGQWQLTFNPLPAGGPYDLSLTGQNKITLTNIMLGEVWLCSGQSNMEWGVERSANAEQEIQNANYPNIRLYKVPRNTSGTPLTKMEATWQRCTPASTKRFSAVAYFFGRKLHQDLNIPIGIIQSAWGGTPIQPWTPRIGFEMTPSLSDIVKQLDDADNEYKKTLPQNLRQLQQWIDDSNNAIKNNTKIPNHPTWPKHAMASQRQPTGLYNAMVNPLIPLSIRGAIWYQGESNVGTRMQYYEMKKALILGWRNVFKQDDLSFYFVQLAPYKYGGRSEEELAYSWEAQTKTLDLPNTGMAVITDITTLNNIHPPNKQDVGLRLALWALAKNYGQDIVYSGPLYKSMTIENNTVRLSFEHDQGLTTNNGKSLDFFQIASEDKVFHDASASIDGELIVVSSDQVPNPVAVRFGFHQLATPNLVNKAGLPASPFRTDNW